MSSPARPTSDPPVSPSAGSPSAGSRPAASLEALPPPARQSSGPADVTARLNAAQRDAVLAPPGPLLVLAGAGTGKTRVVIARIAHLVRQGARPSRILAVTFTNKAAREMLGRAGSLLGRRGSRDADAERPEISTIHSLCVRVLRRHATQLGYPERFAIVDRGEQETTARRVLKELRVAETVLRPTDLLERVGRWKSRGLRPQAALDTIAGDADDSWTLAAAAYRRYQEALRTAGAVDFDDLLLLVDELFSSDEKARQTEAGRFDHLLVDEYQDTSGIQERILGALARDHGSLCVVGDDDQSIYAWRGAEVAHILDFARRWPGARVVKLEENYRSTPEIIHAANALIGHNGRRHGKTLVSKAPSGTPPAILQAQDEADEAARVCGDVESLLRERRVGPGEAVILVRTGEQTRPFEQELRRRGIPYDVVGSRSFFDRREVKDVMAFLRFVVEPDDDLALGRIANLPPRGISAAVLNAARAEAAAGGISLWRALTAARDTGRLSSAAAGGIEQLQHLLRLAAPEADPAAATGGRAASALRSLLETVGYRKHLDRDYADDPAEAETRWACVEEVANALDQHERSAGRGTSPLALVVRGFLDDLVLQVSEEDRFTREKPRGDVLRLMTLHAAKGLEFDCVWMVGLEEGLLPHHRAVTEGLQALDEERRLCYVGVTRARRRLALSLCLTRAKWGKAKPCRPSRFLYELTGQAEKFTERVEPQPAPSGPGRGRTGKAGSRRRR
jgi:DNA helicase-2/ATP-dependent DNA helicase PcrA